MNSYIVETKSGYFLLVAGATNSQEAMKAAVSRAPQFGIPVGARLTSPDPWEPEPPIALYLMVA
jgi:hypothetical protein